MKHKRSVKLWRQTKKKKKQAQEFSSDGIARDFQSDKRISQSLAISGKASQGADAGVPQVTAYITGIQNFLAAGLTGSIRGSLRGKTTLSSNNSFVGSGEEGGGKRRAPETMQVEEGEKGAYWISTRFAYTSNFFAISNAKNTSLSLSRRR